MDKHQESAAATEAMFKAIMDGAEDGVIAALANGADPNAPSPRLTIVTAVGLARMRRQEGACIILAQAGGSEPDMLSRSIDFGEGSWFTWLIENNSWNPKELNDALRVCCEIDGKNALAQAEVLLAKGADANEMGEDRDDTALGAAAINGNVLLAKALLDAGADPAKSGLQTGSGFWANGFDQAMKTLGAAQALRERDVLDRQALRTDPARGLAMGPRL